MFLLSSTQPPSLKSLIFTSVYQFILPAILSASHLSTSRRIFRLDLCWSFARARGTHWITVDRAATTSVTSKIF